MTDLTNREFLVVFNEASKNKNDCTLAAIAAWNEVEGVDYQAELRADLPLTERYDRAVITLKNEDNAVDVMHRLKALRSVRGVLPPLKYLLS